MTAPRDPNVERTPLDALHRDLGARMVPFAGYALPVQYEGIIAEHLHTRAQASLFDVSHMGQAVLRGEDAPAALETLVPGDIAGLAEGQIRYTQLTDEAGGIIDDLMVTRADGSLFLVVNASNKERDFAHIGDRLAGRCSLEVLADRALIALQGPAAVTVLGRHAGSVQALSFMSAAPVEVAGIACSVSRSGYTGEDGFEISVPAERAVELASLLLAEAEVRPAGLGARDSLRLEAGLCLHGSDIDATTTPVEAGLVWSIGKRRRVEGGFPGAATILGQIADGPARRRVGIRPEGKAPARAHTEIADAAGVVLGEVTSGGYGPSVGGPVAMGYVRAAAAAAGTAVVLAVRGRALPATIVRLPFVEHRYATRGY